MKIPLSLAPNPISLLPIFQLPRNDQLILLQLGMLSDYLTELVTLDGFLLDQYLHQSVNDRAILLDNP